MVSIPVSPATKSAHRSTRHYSDFYFTLRYPGRQSFRHGIWAINNGTRMKQMILVFAEVQ